MALLRRDLKFGFVLGAGLLVLGVGYLLISSLGGPADAQARHQTAPADLLDDPAAILNPPAYEPSEPPEPRVAPQREPAREPDPPETDDDWSGLFGLESATGQPPVVTRPPGTTGDRGQPAPGIGSGPDPAFEDLPATPDLNLPDLGRVVDAAAEAIRRSGQGERSQQPESTARDAPGTNRDAPAPAARRHVIEPGDSFVTLAQRYYGDATLFDLIQQANPQVDPRRMRIGQQLLIPDRDAAIAMRDELRRQQDSSRADGGPATHTVAPGETLSSIAAKRLGRAALWERLYELNREVIGPDPAALKVGMVLQLPE